MEQMANPPRNKKNAFNPEIRRISTGNQVHYFNTI